MKNLRMRKIKFGLGKKRFRDYQDIKIYERDFDTNYACRTKEWYGFTEKGLKWLENKGCEWIKIEAEPGDLLLCKIYVPVSIIYKTNIGLYRGLPHSSL
jgi:hypothetical protein